MLDMDILQSLNESVRDEETAEWEFINFYVRDEMVFRLRVLHANEPISFELEITENYNRYVAQRAFDEFVRLSQGCPNMDCRVIERIRGIPEDWVPRQHTPRAHRRPLRRRDRRTGTQD